MRTLAKYVLFSGAAVGFTWAAVSVDLQGRTLYGHFIKAGGDTWVKGAQASWNSAKGEAESRWDQYLRPGEAPEPAAKAKSRAKAKRKRTPRPTPKPAVQENKGAKKRVALLRAAQRQVQKETPPSKKKKTKLDSPTNGNDRAALDRLVAGR
jgi:hypothetical protein